MKLSVGSVTHHTVDMIPSQTLAGNVFLVEEWTVSRTYPHTDDI